MQNIRRLLGVLLFLTASIVCADDTQLTLTAVCHEVDQNKGSSRVCQNVSFQLEEKFFDPLTIMLNWDEQNQLFIAQNSVNLKKGSMAKFREEDSEHLCGRMIMDGKTLKCHMQKNDMVWNKNASSKPRLMVELETDDYCSCFFWYTDKD